MPYRGTQGAQVGWEPSRSSGESPSPIRGGSLSRCSASAWRSRWSSSFEGLRAGTLAQAAAHAASSGADAFVAQGGVPDPSPRFPAACMRQLSDGSPE